MTEYWKSNKMHWCDICRCWMNDNKQAISNHERGMGHQENLKRKLRDMTRKADDEKKAKAHLDKSITKIEEEAEKRYKADLEAAQRDAGHWTWNEDSKYYYHAKYRWYFDPKTDWYYGGEPPEWTQAPPGLPDSAKFGVAPHEGGPVSQRPVGAASSTAGAAGRLGASTSAAAGAAAAVPSRVVQKVVALPSHPLAQVGGHQGPTVGRVGTAKGVQTPGAQAAAAAIDASKRKREEEVAAKAKGLSAEDAAALARREAAKQRVAQRTAQGFGFL